MNLDAAALKAKTDIVELVRRYVPDLKQRGNDWWACCPFHVEFTASFVVHPTGSAGAGGGGYWKCHGACGMGGDVFSFIENIEHCDFQAALRKLAEFHGEAPANGNGNGHKPVHVEVIKKSKPNDNNDPAPDDAPPCRFLHATFGAPVKAWAYLNANNQILGYDARYEENGKKSVLPWRFMDGKWVMRGFSAPSPLYGLEEVAAKPGCIVVMVEGAKSVDGARTFLVGPAVAVVSWQGGCNAVSKVDLTPLYGRTVILWPDADSKEKKEAGQKAMLYFGNKLFHACPKVTYIDPNAPLLPCPECGAVPDPSCPSCAGKGTVENLEPMPDGWDAADAAAEGWGVERWRAWVQPRAKDIKNLLETKAVEEETERLETTKQKALEGKLDSAAPAAHQRLWINWDLARNGHTGIPYPNMDNIVRIFDRDPELKGTVYYDTFSRRVINSRAGKPWTDTDELNLQLRLQRLIGIHKIGKETVRDAVATVAHQHERHAVQDWLQSLDPWDGIPRLATLFSDHFGAKQSEYTSAVGRCWIVSMVARAMIPGCKADNVVVFEGKQGIRKSSAIEAIIGKEWFATAHHEVTEKDFLQALLGKLGVEIAELDSFQRSELEAVKSMVSRPFDTYRKSFGHHTEDYPRQCIFAASTNKDNWNVDETGARRFWPIRCAGEIDVPALRAGRSQLFAEAFAIFKRVGMDASPEERVEAGADWWTTPSDETTQEQNARYEEDPWMEIIESFVVSRDSVHSNEILLDCIKIETEKIDRRLQMRVGTCLRRLGWSSKNTRNGASIRRIWFPGPG